MDRGFVGRRAEQHVLHQVARLAQERGFTTVLISGEAGIGKTRLVREYAGSTSHRVVWARCWADQSVPSLWPWIQVVRELLGQPDAVSLAELGIADRAAVELEIEVFEQAALAIRAKAVDEPLILVIDDIHLADAASVRFLRFLALALDDAPVVVIAMLRTPVAEGAPDRLSEVRDRAVLIDLTGLTEAEARLLVGEDRFTHDLLRASGGNPLHLVHALLRTSEPDDPDELLRELIRHRMRTAPPALGATLAATAVLGRHADRASVADLLGLSQEAVADRFGRLAEAGWVEPRSTTPIHPVVAQVALESVPELLADLHARAADVIGARRATPAELAHHLSEAGPDRAERAALAHLEAAHAAHETHDHETAHHHFSEALSTFRELPRRQHLAFEAAYGSAGALAAIGGPRAADEAYDACERIAADIGDPMLIGRAVARHDIEYYLDLDTVHPQLERCRRALDGLPPGDSTERVVLTAQLATSALAGLDPEGARQRAGDAVEMGRRITDPWALGRALVAEQVANLGPETLERRLRTALEIIELAGQAGAPGLAVHGRFLLKGALLEAGRLQELDSLLPVQRAEIVALGLARFRRHWQWFHCMRAMLLGDPNRVEELAIQCGNAAVELGDPDGVGVFFGQLGVARWIQGRLGELEDAYLDRMHDEPDQPLWPAVLAWVAWHEGRPDAARGYLSRFADPADIPSSQHTLLTLFTMADVVAALGTDDQARGVRQALEPYAGRVVPIAMGAGAFGMIDRALGTLAFRMGDRLAAVAHLTAAMEQAAELPARPFLVDAQLELAAVLLDGPTPSTRRSRHLVDQVRNLTTAHPMPVFDARITQLAARIAAAEGATRRPRVSVLGRFEVVGTDGKPAAWSSRRARLLLKMLVARRGAVLRRDEVFEALWPGEDPALLANRFSVALRAVRRALDPGRTVPPNALVSFADGALCLDTVSVQVDVEDFLSAAATLLAQEQPSPDAVADLLDPWPIRVLADEPDAEWGRPLRDAVDDAVRRLVEQRIAWCRVMGDVRESSARCRQLLELAPFDVGVRLGLVTDLHRAGLAGEAEDAWLDLLAVASELGLDPPYDPRGAD